MAKNYQELQREAVEKVYKHLRGVPYYKWSDEDKRAVNSYIQKRMAKQGFFNNSASNNLANDENFRDEQLAKDAANQSVNNMWGDFSTGGMGETGVPEESYEEPDFQTKERKEQPDREDSKETDGEKPDTGVDKGGEETDETDGLSEEPKPKTEGPTGTPKPSMPEAPTPPPTPTPPPIPPVPVAAEGAAVGAEAGAGFLALLSQPEVWVPILVILILLLILWLGPKLGIGVEKKDANAIGTTTTICLDPGHTSEVGSGTAGVPGGINELEMVLIVAQELKPKLESKGYNVVMTRNDNKAYVTNKERAQICSKAGASLMYRIHLNNPGGIKGPFHWYPPSNLDKVSATSKTYATAIHNEVVTSLGVKGDTTGEEPIDGGVHPDGKPLAGSEEANRLGLPSVLVELMTLSANGETWMQNQTNRAKMVDGMAKGIEKAIPPSSGGSGSTVIAKAKTQLGVPYVLGACHDWTSESNKDGCKNYDCSGFAGWAWYWGTNKKVNIDGTTRAAYDNRNSSKYTIINDKNSLQSGDLIYWEDGNIHHVGMFVSKDTYIHAPSTGDVVKISTFSGKGVAVYLRPNQ